MNKVLDIEKGMKEMKENNETAQETQKEDLMVNQAELKERMKVMEHMVFEIQEKVNAI